MTKLGIWFDEKGAKKTLSINDYNSLVARKEKEKLADFIYNRFHSRYIKPFIYDNDEFKVNHLNGFSIMANYCLTIEAFESFRRGWLNSKNKSPLAFEYFFSTESNFSDFKNISDEFYKNVRCGILHQGETTDGWKISRKNKNLFDKTTKTIDAVIFLKLLDNAIESYTEHLKNQNFHKGDWSKVFKKMDEIIKNCN